MSILELQQTTTRLGLHVVKLPRSRRLEDNRVERAQHDGAGRKEARGIQSSPRARREVGVDESGPYRNGDAIKGG